MLVYYCMTVTSELNKKNYSFIKALFLSNNNKYNWWKITGQSGSKQTIMENPGVFLNPDQPLIAAVTITKEDLRRQEERVKRARLRLQEALVAA